MSDTPVIRRAQFRGVTLRRDDLVAEARKYMDEHPGWPELGDTSDIMADFAMMIAARVAVRMMPPPGHIVMPREPTEAMLESAERDENNWRTTPTPPGRMARHYRAMIAEITRKEDGE